jgi:hypothetical protein
MNRECQLTMSQPATEDHDALIDLRVQAVIESRRRANASGQAGEDIDHIRAAVAELQGDTP